MSLLITTCPGLEDVSLKEIKKLIPIRNAKLKPQGVQGRLIIECGCALDNASLALNMNARTIHRVSILLCTFKLSRKYEGLNEIYKKLVNCNLEDYITPHTTFAIRAERLGVHEYTSIDIAKVAGQAVIDSISLKYGSKPKVNLDAPAIILRVDVVGDSCLISICTTGDDSLHKRGYRVYDHPAALKPTIAYAIAMLSQIPQNGVVVDPMCGGGTIPIECYFLNKSLSIYGIDISPKHIHGAKLNALAAGILNEIKFIVGDARKLNELINFDVDRMISNLPYGIRIGRKHVLKTLYEKFLKSARQVLKDDGIITLLTTEYKLIKNVADNLKYTIKSYRRIFHGNLSPFIILLEKT